MYLAKIMSGDQMLSRPKLLLPKLIAEVKTLPFQHEFGRGIYWQGIDGVNYRYTNRNHCGVGFSPIFQELKLYIEKIISDRFKIEQEFNHILCNYYKPNQKLAAHKDDEPELIHGIASFSLGDPAAFAYGQTRDCLDETVLMNGDLLYGDKEFFTNNYHKVSAPYDDGHRYNFTLRTVQT